MLHPPAITLPAQTPIVPASPLPFTSLKAEYKWSFRGTGQSGSGTLALRLEPLRGKLVLEVFSFGDRLALVDGDREGGYQIVLPKQHVNRTVPLLADLPLPILPQAGSVETLARALADGEGEGLVVEKRDLQGPVRLRYTGQDDAGQPVEVQLIRKRWEPVK